MDAPVKPPSRGALTSPFRAHTASMRGEGTPSHPSWPRTIATSVDSVLGRTVQCRPRASNGVWEGRRRRGGRGVATLTECHAIVSHTSHTTPYSHAAAPQRHTARSQRWKSRGGFPLGLGVAYGDTLAHSAIRKRKERATTHAQLHARGS